jgi:hypothetical protein
MRAQLIKKGSIYTNTQAWYLKTGKKYTGRDYIELTNRMLPFIRSKLNFSDKTTIVIACIKAKRTSGSFCCTQNMISVDPRQSCYRFVDSLVHELVHAQQYHLGQLKAVFDANEGTVFHWKNENFGKHPVSHAKYMALPWEIEARTVAAELTKEIKKVFNL